MDEIYNKAIQVNVHLGEGDERTEVVAKAVNKLGAASLAVLAARKIGVGEETMRQYEKVADEVLRKLSTPDLIGRTADCMSYPQKYTSSPSWLAAVKLLTSIRNLSRIPIWQTPPYIALTLVPQSLGLPRGCFSTESGILLWRTSDSFRKPGLCNGLYTCSIFET
jgi:hypothetical protein